MVQDVLPGRDHTAPFTGVIVRWRARLGDQTDAQSIRLRVVRAVTSNTFVPTASSELEEIPAGAGTYRFDSRIPIEAGAQIAIESGIGAAIEARAPAASDALSFDYGTSPPDGTATSTPLFTSPGEERTFNADVEADFDSDGYGDESQDQDDDNDGLTDAFELSKGLNPLNADSDGDRRSDAADACPTIRGDGQDGCPVRSLSRFLLSSVPHSITRRSFRKGITARVECDKPCALDVELRASAAKVNFSANGLLLGERSLRYAAGSRNFRIRPSRSLLRRLRKRFTAELRVVATDRSGNRLRKRQSIRVR